MTKKEVIDHFDYLLKSMGKKPDKAFIGSAYNMGIRDFWGAHRWAFKEKRTTVATTVNQEYVELPFDCEGVVSVLEHETENGRKLRYLPSDEYDRLVPYSTDLATDTPAYYKIVYDYDSGYWRLYCYPTPDAVINLHLIYHTIADDGGNVPTKYTAAVFSHIAKFLALPGTAEYAQAMAGAAAEDARLARDDSPHKTGVSRFLDSYESEQPRHKKWYEDEN